MTDLENALLIAIAADLAEAKGLLWSEPGDRYGSPAVIQKRRRIRLARDNAVAVDHRRWRIGSDSAAWRQRRSRSLAALEAAGYLQREGTGGRTTVVRLTLAGLEATQLKEPNREHVPTSNC